MADTNVPDLEAIKAVAVPQQLCVRPEHPWFDPYWVQRVHVLLDGEKVFGAVMADAIGGEVECYEKPLRIVGSNTLATVRKRGKVEIIANGRA